MENADRPLVVVIPTEMERVDVFWDAAALAGTALAAWWLALHDLWPLAVLPLLLVGLWTLTGEPACDVPFLGAIAAGLRSKLGVRRAHEWLMAWWHYFKVRTWPDFKVWLAATRVGTFARRRVNLSAGGKLWRRIRARHA